MAQSHDQPRTVRLPPTYDNDVFEVANKVLLWKPDEEEKRSTNSNSAKHPGERQEPQQEKITNCKDEPKPLEG